MSVSLKRRQKGFAVLELILIIVIIAAVVGVGAWVYKQRHQQTANSTTSDTANKPAAGTTASIDQLTQQDASSEANINSKHEATEQSNAQATNTSLNNLGGAYNESSF